MTTETRERITDPERLSRLEGAYGHLATKADIAALGAMMTERSAESEIRTSERIAASEAKTMERIAESEIRTNERIAESEARTMAKIAESEIRMTEKIAASEARIIKWVVGAALAALAAFASLLAAGGTLLYRLLS